MPHEEITMAKGGARPRTGPGADPTSARSERARRTAKKATSVPAKKAAEAAAPATASAVTEATFSPTALPARGRAGNPPAFPLPKIVRFVLDVSGGKPVKVPDTGAADAFRKRELEIWRQLWKTPQAVAWERDSWRWPTIAKYCRIMTTTEVEPDASAALLSRERELRIECGLTPDGLKMNGWAIAPDQLAEKRATRATGAKPAAKAAAVRRLRG